MKSTSAGTARSTRSSSPFTALKVETAKPIEGVSPGDHFFLDLRLYGYAWYKTLNLPDDDDLTMYSKVSKPSSPNATHPILR